MKPICAAIFLTLLALPGGGAHGSDAYGPLIWSDDGRRAYTWHDDQVMELDLEMGEMTPVTDSIPPPHAIALDEENRLLVVSQPTDFTNLTLFSMDEGEPVLCYLPREKGQVIALNCHDGELTVVGRGYVARLDLFTGAPLDSIEWIGRSVPADLSFRGGNVDVLQQQLVVEYDRASRSIPVGTDGILRAVFAGRNGRSFLEQRGGDLQLLMPEGSARPAGKIEPDERFAGAQYSREGEKLLIVIERPGVNEGNRTTRLEIRDACTGERIQFLRSARSIRGVDQFEGPYSAAIHPDGKWLLVNWLLTGIQLWNMEDWSLLQTW